MSSTTLPDYTAVTVLESKQDTSILYSLKDDKMIKIGNADNIAEIQYNNNLGVYAYINNSDYGNNLVHNNIDILRNTGKSEINNFFSASDIMLSPKATKIAFRSYKSDSLQSAEGMKIYSLDKDRYINIKSQVLISGSLYRWLNDNEIMYYGISDDTSSNGEIFKYNLVNNNETVVLKLANGYCTFFIPFANGILYLEKSGEESKLYFYDIESHKNKLVSLDLGDIWDAVPDNDGKFIYLIANKINETNCSIYKVDINNLSIQRVTYDFPQNVEKNGGAALDSKGELYFCGIIMGSNNLKNDLFSFNTRDASINLISNGIHTGIYRVFSSNSIKQP